MVTGADFWAVKKVSLAGEPKMYGSHETSYQSLLISAKGVFRVELKKPLRTKRMFPHV
jgi:hypothetical protein